MLRQGGPAGAGPAPRGRVLLVTFLAQARKVTRPPARAPVRRNRRQGGRKTPSTAVQRCLKTRLWTVSPASSAALRTARSAGGRAPFLARPRKGAKRRTPPQGRPPAAGSRAAGPFKGAALTRHPAAAKLNGPSLARSPPCPDPQPGGLEGGIPPSSSAEARNTPLGPPPRGCLSLLAQRKALARPHGRVFEETGVKAGENPFNGGSKPL